MVRLRLPRLVGRREAVADLLTTQQVPPALLDEDVVLLCRDLATGSASFADELVKDLLQQRGAARLLLVGAPERFVEDARAAAVRHGVDGRVLVRTAVEVGV
jgi:dihydroxyacetone kinase DhaKLM complex PTS-EIIA-like component DhaM